MRERKERYNFFSQIIRIKVAEEEEERVKEWHVYCPLSPETPPPPVGSHTIPERRGQLAHSGFAGCRVNTKFPSLWPWFEPTTSHHEVGALPLSYGVVPKELLTFLGSLYKEVSKTTSGTLVYRFDRQTARKKKKKKIFLRKILWPRLRMYDFISGTFR